MTQLSKDNVVVNAPIYAVFGRDRRELKKKRSLLRSFIRNFSYNNQLENDMHTIYGSTDRIIDAKRETRILAEVTKDLLEVDLTLAELHK
jgi:hypothetical protein